MAGLRMWGLDLADAGGRRRASTQYGTRSVSARDARNSSMKAKIALRTHRPQSRVVIGIPLTLPAQSQVQPGENGEPGQQKHQRYRRMCNDPDHSLDLGPGSECPHRGCPPIPRQHRVCQHRSQGSLST